MIDLASRLEDLSPAKRELLLRQLKKLNGETPQPVIQPRAGQRADFPLSYAQQRLWFLDQLQPGSPAYNLPTVVRLRGALDLGTYRRSLTEIVRRHESLRTRFAFRGGIPIQVIEDARLEVLVVDLRALPAER